MRPLSRGGYVNRLLSSGGHANIPFSSGGQTCTFPPWI